MDRWLMWLSRRRYGMARVCWRMADLHQLTGQMLLRWARVHEQSGAVLWSRAMEARRAKHRAVKP